MSDDLTTTDVRLGEIYDLTKELHELRNTQLALMGQLICDRLEKIQLAVTTAGGLIIGLLVIELLRKWW